MKIKLEPINDTTRKAVLALTVREDQPFVAQNDYSLNEADEANARAPGTARPFAIYVSAIPAMIFALCIQKHLVRGLSFGAVKG